MNGSKTFAASALLVLLAVVAAYSNHFSNPFELDDMHTIVHNGSIRDLRSIPRFFADARTFSTLPANQTYRPVTTTLNAVDTWLGGTGKPEPRAFHVSIFLAFLVLGVFLYVFLFLILREVFGQAWVPWVALAGCGLFLLHAANAETVNYVIARSDSFSTLMVLVSFVVYLGRPAWRRGFAYLIPFGIGFLAKETALMFAPLLVVYLVLFREGLPLRNVPSPRSFPAIGRALRAAGPTLLLSAGLVGLSLAMTPASVNTGGTSRWGYLLTQPFVAFHYFNSFLVPVNLAVESDWTAFTNPFDDRVFAGIAFIVLLLTGAGMASRRPTGRPVAFGILWFLIALIPTSSVIPLAEVLNDHRPFFPYVGLTLAACGLGCMAIVRNEQGLRRSVALRTVVALAIVVLLGAHAWGVHRRNEVWKSAESLWGEAAGKSPGSGRVLMNYALTLMGRGDYPRALEYFEKARAAWPRYSYIHINLGVVNAAMGDAATAELHFRDGLALDPKNPEAYTYYSAFLRRQGRETEAVEVGRRGLELSPAHLGLKAFLAEPAIAPAVAASPTPESLIGMSLALYRSGRFEESLAAARQAAGLRPDWDVAWNNITAAYCSLGRWDEAIEAGEKAVHLNPRNELARNNLAWARKGKATATAR